MANNLLSHDLVQRDSAQGTVHDNIESADGGYYVDLSAGDLHLSPSSPAVDAGGAPEPGLCDDDIDGHPRDAPSEGCGELRSKTQLAHSRSAGRAEGVQAPVRQLPARARSWPPCRRLGPTSGAGRETSTWVPFEIAWRPTFA